MRGGKGNDERTGGQISPSSEIIYKINSRGVMQIWVQIRRMDGRPVPAARCHCRQRSQGWDHQLPRWAGQFPLATAHRSESNPAPAPSVVIPTLLPPLPSGPHPSHGYQGIIAKGLPPSLRSSHPSSLPPPTTCILDGREEGRIQPGRRRSSSWQSYSHESFDLDDNDASTSHE